jgi:hypothetical protein
VVDLQVINQIISNMGGIQITALTEKQCQARGGGIKLRSEMFIPNVSEIDSVECRLKEVLTYWSCSIIPLKNQERNSLIRWCKMISLLRS